MLRGIEQLGQVKRSLVAQNDVIANNLANLGTTGFKRETTAFHKILDQKSREMTVAVTRTDQSTGDFKKTSNPLDVAIQGKGYFSVQTPQGVRYTRNGSFQLSDKGLLVDHAGNPVLSDKGTIAIPPGTEAQIAIGLDGRISSGESDFGSLLVTNFTESTVLSKVGDNLFDAVEPVVEAADFQLVQGSLEMSNVNSVQEMVEMMDALRLFETSQSMSRIQDESLSKAISQLA